MLARSKPLLISSAGDSQLVRVHSTPPDPGQPEMLVEILDTFDSLGPIVDFVVVDLDRQGQGQVHSHHESQVKA